MSGWEADYWGDWLEWGFDSETNDYNYEDSFDNYEYIAGDGLTGDQSFWDFGFSWVVEGCQGEYFDGSQENDCDDWDCFWSPCADAGWWCLDYSPSTLYGFYYPQNKDYCVTAYTYTKDEGDTYTISQAGDWGSTTSAD